MKFLCSILGKTRLDRIRNDDVRQQFNIGPLTINIEKRQLGWMGHVWRMQEDGLSSVAEE